MIIIENMNSYGRFGNKMIFYLNMRGLSKKYSTKWYSPNWEGTKIFNNTGYSKSTQKRNSIVITREEISKFSNEDMLEIATKYNVILRPPMLGGSFFSIYDREKNDISSFLNSENSNVDNKNSISIHFRGTDFHSWIPESILPVEYYINAIDHVIAEYGREKTFNVFTDDHSLESIKVTVKYLEDKKIKWNYGPDSNPQKNTGKFMNDFLQIKNSSIIISSPSTFCISAGMLGNAKIIHSRDWIDSRVERNDKFWLDLSSGGSSCYSLYKSF